MEDQSFSGFEALTDPNARDGGDQRAILLRILTDLYVQKLAHTAEEERHYTELALRLLETVDVPTRLAVASRLTRHLSPPLKVLRGLAGDLAEAAAPPSADALLHPSAAVPATQGVAAVRAEHAPAKAKAFGDASQGLDAATADQLNELFFAANAEERRLILVNFEVVAPLSLGYVGITRDDAIGERLEAAALGRRREEFARHLGHALQIPREQAWRILHDDLGEPLVIAGKALGIAREALHRILMFANPAVGHSVARVHALAALYDEITRRAAESMVGIWQALAKDAGARAHHRPPAADPDTRLRARPAATQRAAPTAPRTAERRSAS